MITVIYHMVQEVLILDHVALKGHVNAVKELADVLVLHGANLLDQSTCLAYVVNVVAHQHNLVLDIGATRYLNARVSVHNPHDLLAQEVADLDLVLLASDGNIDREVSV